MEEVMEEVLHKISTGVGKISTSVGEFISSTAAPFPSDTAVEEIRPPPTSGATTINGSSPTVSTLPAQANAIITFLNNNSKAAPAKLDEEDKMGEYLEILTEHISRLLEIKEGEKPSRLERNLPSSQSLKKIRDFFSDGINGVKYFFKDSSPKTLARQLLADVGKAHFALAGLVVVADILEKSETRSANKKESLCLMKKIQRLVYHIRSLEQWPQIKQEMENVIREATVLIVEGSILCCNMIESPGYLSAAAKKVELAHLEQELNDMKGNMVVEIAIKLLKSNVRLPPFDGSHHPVGMEKQIGEVALLLEEKREDNALAVILHGIGGMGKSTLGNAVYAVCSERDKSFKYSKVQLFDHVDKNHTILEAQNLILKDLMGPEMTTEIRTLNDGQCLLRDTLKTVAAFIFIDNVDVLGESGLGRLLPKDMSEAKRVRLLLTAVNKNVLIPRGMKTPPIIYEMKYLSKEEAKSLLKRDITDQGINDDHFYDIIERCCGIPLLLELVGAFIRSAPNKLEAYHQFMKDKYFENEPFDKIESSYLFAFHHLPRNCQEPFLDICFFFRGWDWNTVEDIVGKTVLHSLEARALVTKDTNGVVSVHNVILSLAKKMETKTRFNVSNAGQMKKLVRMKEQDIKNIKGIWVESENTDLFRILATKLNSMYESLRVLHLGNSRGVNLSCDEAFGELIFFQGAVPRLPFEASKCKELKYLSYQPTDSKFTELVLPPSLTHIELDGSSTDDEFRIYSQNPQDLKKLRILKFKQFPKLKTLLDKLGGVVNGGLQELTISKCESIEELPQSITKLKSLKTLNLHGCKNLKRLPRGFEELSSLTSLDLSFCEKLLTLPHRIGYISTLVNLSINNCPSLRRIPESIGMNSFTELDMSCCSSLRELPSRFGGLQKLISLNLSECTSLEKLPQGFGQLKCLVKLNLSNCTTLEQLCWDFHCLSKLEMLDLSKCERLEGKWMDSLVKMETLQNINIKGSSLLENRWQEIHRNGNQSCSFQVYMQEDFGSTEQTALLSNLDVSLIDKQGIPFRISTSLSINSTSLFMFHSNPDDDFPFPLIEEVIDYNQNGLAFKMFYIGKHYSKLHIKVKDNISAYSNKISKFGKSWVSTSDTNVQESWLKSYSAEEPIYLKLEVGDTRSSDRWKVLSKRELEEFLLGHCERYMNLKKLVECSSQEPYEESNLDLLRELFATSEEREAIFLTKYVSDKDSDEPFIRRVDELKGKTILLEMGSEDLCDDIGCSVLAKMYDCEKDRLGLEIISIPMVDSKIKKERSSNKVPWLVLRYPLAIARAVRYFLVADCGWKGDQLWYGSVFWVIKPDGTISICTPFMLFMLNMWKPKISSSPQKIFEELARKEWYQLNAVSNLEFLFSHLENVSNQVKGIQKMICIYDGNKEVTCSLGNIASSKLKDSIHIIYIPRYAHKKEMSRFTDSIYKNYNSWEKPKMSKVEIQDGIPLLNLSEDDAMRFWMRILFLKEEIKKIEDEYQENGIDNNGRILQMREMKTLLHPFLLMQEEQSVVFMDEDGKMIANCRGDVMEWIFKEDEGDQDRAKRLIKQLMKVSKLERESSSMISTVSTNIMQAAPEAIRGQENVNSISEYTSDLLELVQLNHLLNFNKEGSGSSTPNWPAPKGFHERLKSSLFEDTSMIAETIKSGEDILETLDLESLVKKVSDEAQLAAAGHVLLVAVILWRFEHVCGAYRNECLILLEEMNRLSQYINKYLNEQPEKMRRATKWLVHCYIMCCAQIHETSNNIMCCAQIREPSNNIMCCAQKCCAQIRKPSNNIMCSAQIHESSNNIMCCAQIRKPSNNIMCCAKIEPSKSKFAKFFKEPVNGKKMLALQQWLRRSQEELRT